ncbi:MAG: hypothetical protein ACREYF_16815 [Gammaproteobacteria bacterium]
MATIAGLTSRLDKLEQKLDNGPEELLLVFMRDGETEAQAYKRVMRADSGRVVRKGASVVYISPSDAGL